MLETTAFSEEDAKAVSRRNYPPPDAVYHLPGWETMRMQSNGITVAAMRGMRYLP